MNIKEIAYEVTSDLEAVKAFAERKTKKVRRAALKRRDKRYTYLFELKTKKYNTWFVNVKYSKKNPVINYICHYVNNDGYNAVAVILKPELTFLHFSGHFFERYNERFLNGQLSSKKEILKKYFEHNNHTSLTLKEGGNDIFGYNKDGIVLGYKVPDINWRFYKTFITKDMVHAGQQEAYNITSTAFHKFWDEVHSQTESPDYYYSTTSGSLAIYKDGREQDFSSLKSNRKPYHNIRTLIIHPDDKTTKFLTGIYENIPNKTVITGGVNQEELVQLIKEHDRVMMMGHGSPNGLFKAGSFPEVEETFVINKSHVALLNEKEENVFIWCNADMFVNFYELKGFYTGMFISEVDEAYYCGLPGTTQDIVDESNYGFTNIIKKHINENRNVIHENVKKEYAELSESNPVALYNYNRLYTN